ncbi:LPS export ABC transporter permease LptG [Halomonas urumqiensis]|uniref:LPS export ABC transporter permease LptG n=1 Tax=Halomonas urumqiensis TaxID=1684789 RepID=A0A2N7UEW1_9GAMM|nr:LPS export ABC transporter permease LptG [Halomonas urumqiensis]PMR78986.1 LPS export ABC transporter permease LptG [Halomonas urumqiensis]PTB00979.1 LPS export ABC transporter permease LptG [Halomonas urumqiensis]GHE22923.1 LPS export ABC transporter permease LptG [Halomonas urumqiensis]
MIADRFDRYLARNVLGAILVVQVVLLGLDLVITYINDLGDVEGEYGAFQVLLYLIMRLPWRFYQYSPVGVLIGALIGLGSMASSNELTVMRAAGRSLARILWGAMKPIILVVAVVLLIAEFVSPRTEQFASAWRLERIQGTGAVVTQQGGWQREDDSIYRFGAIRADDTVLDLTRYRFDDRTLREAMSAERAVWRDSGWQLENVAITRIEEERTETEHHATHVWDTSLTPAQLDRLLRDVESQAPSELWAYAGYLRDQGQQATEPLLHFWQKMLMPLTMGSLVLVAASFVFGPLRSVAAGTRVFYGVITGLSFKYLQDLLAPASMVFGFSPAWAVLAPTFICAVVGFYLLRRTG